MAKVIKISDYKKEKEQLRKLAKNTAAVIRRKQHEKKPNG